MIQEIRNLRRSLDLEILEYKTAKQQVRDEKANLLEAQKQLEHSVEAQKIIQELAKETQKQAHAQLTSIVCLALEAVFDEPYRFEIIFESKRGKTEPRFTFERDGHHFSPKLGMSGGVVFVAAFAMRVAAMLLQKPKVRPLIVSDEPFRGISEKNAPRVGEMLMSLAKKTGVQIIQSTHMRGLACGKIIRLPIEE